MPCHRYLHEQPSDSPDLSVLERANRVQPPQVTIIKIVLSTFMNHEGQFVWKSHFNNSENYESFKDRFQLSGDFDRHFRGLNKRKSKMSLFFKIQVFHKFVDSDRYITRLGIISWIHKVHISEEFTMRSCWRKLLEGFYKTWNMYFQKKTFGNFSKSSEDFKSWETIHKISGM